MYDRNKGSMNYCSKRRRDDRRDVCSEQRDNNRQRNDNCVSAKREGNCGSKHNNSCCCGNNSGCHSKPDVVYYPCKESNCEKYICEANNLIDRIACKTDDLNENLMVALEDQGLVGDGLSEIKKELSSIAHALGALQKGLCAAQNALDNVVEDIEENAVSNQNNAIKAINNAIDDEESINNILDCLDAAVNDAFECLEDTGCPVLVPKPSNECGCSERHCSCKNDCGC